MAEYWVENVGGCSVSKLCHQDAAFSSVEEIWLDAYYYFFIHAFLHLLFLVMVMVEPEPILGALGAWWEYHHRVPCLYQYKTIRWRGL